MYFFAVSNQLLRTCLLRIYWEQTWTFSIPETGYVLTLSANEGHTLYAGQDQLYGIIDCSCFHFISEKESFVESKIFFMVPASVWEEHHLESRPICLMIPNKPANTSLSVRKDRRTKTCMHGPCVQHLCPLPRIKMRVNNNSTYELRRDTGKTIHVRTH